MTQRKTIGDYRRIAAEAAAQANRYSTHPGSRFYCVQADYYAKACLQARTLQAARRHAGRAAEMATKAALMAGASVRKAV